jgi:hypothetical protein
MGKIKGKQYAQTGDNSSFHKAKNGERPLILPGSGKKKNYHFVQILWKCIILA